MLGWTLAGEVLESWSGYYSVAQIETTIHKLPPLPVTQECKSNLSTALFAAVDPDGI